MEFIPGNEVKVLTNFGVESEQLLFPENSASTRVIPGRWKLFFVLAIVYFVTSLGHFVHNAEFIGEYPNLPAWISPAGVYAAWAAITSVGVLGLLLIRHKVLVSGLLTVAVYAGMGFDGLGHYHVAPMSMHPFTANFTILSEVAAAALLLVVTLYLLKLQLFRNVSGRQAPYPVVKRPRAGH